MKIEKENSTKYGKSVSISFIAKYIIHFIHGKANNLMSKSNEGPWKRIKINTYITPPLAGRGKREYSSERV